MANIVVFQGVEVTLPLDVAFAHKEGCLEIDLTGLSGRLQLRPGVSQTHHKCFTCWSTHNDPQCYFLLLLHIGTATHGP